MPQPLMTTAEVEALKQRGYKPGKPDSIPPDASPYERTRIAEWEAFTEAQRGVKADKPKHDPLDHDHDGRKGGHIDNRRKRGKK